MFHIHKSINCSEAHLGVKEALMYKAVFPYESRAGKNCELKKKKKKTQDRMSIHADFILWVHACILMHTHAVCVCVCERERESKHYILLMNMMQNPHVNRGDVVIVR